MPYNPLKIFTAEGNDYEIVDANARGLIGDLNELQVTEKSNLVEAINELAQDSLREDVQRTIGYLIENLYPVSLYNNGTAIAKSGCTAAISDKTFVFTSTVNGELIFGTAVTTGGTVYTDSMGPKIPFLDGGSVNVSLASEFVKNYVSYFNANDRSISYQRIITNSFEVIPPEGATYFVLRIGVPTVTTGAVYRTDIVVSSSKNKPVIEATANKDTQYAVFNDGFIDSLDFVVGGLSSSGKIDSKKYRVSTRKMNYFNKPVIVTVPSGMASGYDTFDSYTKVMDEWSGWFYAGTYVIPANTYFRIQCRRQPEDTTEIVTDPATFVSEYRFALDCGLTTAEQRVDILTTTFKPTEISWEQGYYSTSGKPNGSTSDMIRTSPAVFIQTCKGSMIINTASNARLRYCVYTKPYEDYFVARYDVNAGGRALITYDCYIRVHMAYTDDTEFDLDTWIANLPPMWSGEIIQFNPMIVYSPADPTLSDSSENGVQNKIVTQTFNIMMPSFVLPANWESKVQTIQEAQGTKFTFAIQTDTHYALDGDIYSGANLKVLTNRIGFDFVANLGDVIKGYAGDENAPENMRAAMTEIMTRYVRGISCPLLIAMGNHDTNKQWADAHSGTPFTFDEVWGREFRPALNTIPGVVYQTGLMYYYKDFNDVRVIVLNTQDGDSGGFGIGSTQISWLTNTALNTDKPVLVLSHVPIINGWSVSSNYVSSYADAVAAIKAFQTGGGTVIGCMSGHTHTQESQIVDELLYVTFRNSATLCEVVMVDLANKRIDTIPVGFTGAGNRNFMYDLNLSPTNPGDIQIEPPDVWIDPPINPNI